MPFSAGRPDTSPTRLKSLSRLSSQSRTSGSSSKSCRRRMLPLTLGQITGQAAGRSRSRHDPERHLGRKAYDLNGIAFRPRAPQARTSGPARHGFRGRRRRAIADGRYGPLIHRGEARGWTPGSVAVSRSDHSNISVANEIPGSRTGQRPQARGCAGPHPAIITSAKRHVRPCLATSGRVSGMPPKQ